MGFLRSNGLAALCSSIAFTGASAIAADGPIMCKQGKAERSVSVEYPEAGKKIPCEVKYKRAEGDERSIFRANAQEGFCESKAQEFAEKLKGMGWDCGAGEAKP